MLETSCADKPDKLFVIETIPALAVPWFDRDCEVQVEGLWRSAPTVKPRPESGFLTIRYQQRQEEYWKVSVDGKTLVQSTYPKKQGGGHDNVSVLISEKRLPNRSLQGETNKSKKRRTYTVGLGWDDEQPQKYAPKTKEKKQFLEEDFDTSDGTFE